MEKYSWVRYISNRINNNKNFILMISGPTGSGKTWAGLSLGEMLDEQFNVTIELENFEERSTSALEGIENKTGTFHLEIDCPITGEIGELLQCNLIAQIEDPQLVSKEVDFTCYISSYV